jgi:predicted SAM-dependent methyltransferase
MDVRKTWPFPDASVELVILGDIIEHLFYPEALEALTEARRVSQKLVITVPEDTRHEGTEIYEEDAAGARAHCYTWTEKRLKKVLRESEWIIKDWLEVDYNFVPRGFFIYCV